MTICGSISWRRPIAKEERFTSSSPAQLGVLQRRKVYVRKHHTIETPYQAVCIVHTALSLVFPWHDIVLSLRPCLTSVHTVSSTTVHSYSSALVLYCLSLPLALCSLLFVCIWLASIRPNHLLGVWHKSTCVGPPVWCARRFQLHCCPDLLSLPDPT